MKQLKKDMLCYYCHGCNKEENESFEGVRNCKVFVAGIDNWQEKFRKELKRK